MGPMETRSRKRGSRSGQVLVLAAATLVVMMLMAALTVDVGRIFCADARLQNTADASAVAAALELVEKRNAGVTESVARAAASSEAQELAGYNWDLAGCEVQFGTYSGGVFTQQGAETTATAIQVRAYRDEDAPGGPLRLFFAPLMGLNTVNVDATASTRLAAGIMGLRSTGNLMPFAVYSEDLPAGGESFTVYDQDLIVPGNFGLVNFDGGPVPTPELADWITNGYNEEIVLDPDTGFLWLGGSPGFRAALEDEIQARIGDTVLICVYDQITEQGSNADFRIVRFAAVTLEAVDLHADPPYVRARMARIVNVPYADPGGTFDDNLVTIQLFQ